MSSSRMSGHRYLVRSNFQFDATANSAILLAASSQFGLCVQNVCKPASWGQQRIACLKASQSWKGELLGLTFAGCELNASCARPWSRPHSASCAIQNRPLPRMMARLQKSDVRRPRFQKIACSTCSMEAEKRISDSA